MKQQYRAIAGLSGRPQEQSRLVSDFLARLQKARTPFLVLTNNPIYSPAELQDRLAAGGLAIPAENFFTAAMATAEFLAQQRPDGSAFVVGIESDVIGAKNKFSGEVSASGPAPTISMRPARSARRAACACALVRPGIGCWSTLRLV